MTRLPITAADRALLARLGDGLPLVARPYRAIGVPLGVGEGEVMERLRRLLAEGVIARFGVVVRHRRLGYRANAMVVWDIADGDAGAVGRTLAALPFVTLCYRRARRPGWPYNIFCMIHGRDRGGVEARIAEANAAAAIALRPQAVLFSGRCYKQAAALVPSEDGDEDDDAAAGLDAIDRRIINGLQGGLPLVERPFAAAALDLALDEATLLARLARLKADGWLTRFGPMFNADRLGGATTLAALAVPAADFDRVAAIVNGFPEVAHNYARDHPLNMWFVVASETPARIGAVIAAIERATGLAVVDLPKEAEFFCEARFEA